MISNSYNFQTVKRGEVELGGVATSPYIVGAFYNDPRLYGVSASVHF